MSSNLSLLPRTVHSCLFLQHRRVGLLYICVSPCSGHSQDWWYHFSFIMSTSQNPPVSHPWEAGGPLPLPVYFFTLSIFFASFLSSPLKKMRGIGWSDLPFRWKKKAFSLSLTLYLLWYFLNCNIKQHLHSPILLKWHRSFQVNSFQPGSLWATLTESRMCSYLASSSKYFNFKQMLIFFYQLGLLYF